jgi:DNA-binding response OmpR family regulator
MDKKGVAVFDKVVIDFDRMELRRSGKLVPATALEFKILQFFVENPGYVFSREELIETVWPRRGRVNARTVDNYILHLRQKLEDNPAHPAYFQTVHGVGYRFVPQGLAAKARNESWRRGSTPDGRPEKRLAP